jgi:SAM-dependent methyltransferase
VTIMPSSFKQGWATIDQAGDPATYVRCLDSHRGGRDDDPEHYRVVFDLLNAQEGERIVDVGCGTGGAMRALAPRLGGAGRLVGVDRSAAMIATAQQRAAALSLPGEHRVADARHLPFADGEFDGCYATGLFEIVDEPRQILAEMARVTRPGGRIVATCADADTLMIDASDRRVTRALVHFICDHEWNGWLGRQLPGLCKELGLSAVTVVNTTRLMTDLSFFLDHYLIRASLERARAAGVATADEAARWVEDLERRDRAGRFLAGFTSFRVLARKP